MSCILPANYPACFIRHFPACRFSKAYFEKMANGKIEVFCLLLSTSYISLHVFNFHAITPINSPAPF